MDAGRLRPAFAALVVWVLRSSGPASFGPCVVRALRSSGPALLLPCAVWALRSSGPAPLRVVRRFRQCFRQRICAHSVHGVRYLIRGEVVMPVTSLRVRTWCSLVLVLSAPLVVAAQQPTQATNAVATPQPKKLTIETYFDLEDVQGPQLSPDGKQVIYTRRWVDKLNDRWESSLWIMNADGSRARHLVDGSNATWSPDGSRIAYLARGEPTGTQVWVRFMDGDAAPTQITRLTESPSDIEWSPDGKWLAFRMLVPERDEWRLPMPAAPKGAKWVEPPRVVTRLNYRRDRQGFIDNGFRQIFVVPADGGTARQVTSGPWEHGTPQWMKD